MRHAIRSLALFLSIAATLLRGQVWTQDPAFHPRLVNDTNAVASTHFVPAADGRVLAYGNFTHLHAGDVATPGLAYLRAEGSIDGTFAAQIDADHWVAAAAPLRDGRVLVLLRDLSPHYSLIRLLTNGTVDTTFTPITVGYPITMVPQPDSRVLGYGSYVVINDTHYSDLIRFKADGTFDSTFAPNLTANFRSISTFTVGPDSRVWVSGDGQTDPNQSSLGKTLRLDDTGAPDTTVAVIRTTGAFAKLAVQPDGKLVGAVWNTISRYNADGSPDSAYQPRLPNAYSVTALNVRADGKLLVDAQVGDPNVALMPVTFLVSADGTQVTDLRATFGSDQTTSVACALGDNTTWLIHGLPIVGSTIPLAVPVIASNASSDLTPGPAATTAATPSVPITPVLPPTPPFAPTFQSVIVPYHPTVARVSANATSMTELNLGLINRYAGYVGMAKIDAESRLVIQGSFTAVDGHPRPGLARFLPSGALDDSYAPALGDGVAQAITLFGQTGELLLSETTLGTRQANGIYDQPLRLVRIRADGTVDPAFAPTLDFGASIGWLAFGNNGRVLVSYFTPDANQEANLRLGWVDATGKLASTLPTRFSGLEVISVIADGPIEWSYPTTGGPGGSSSGGDSSGSTSSGTTTTGTPSTGDKSWQPTPGIYGNLFSSAWVLPDGRILLVGAFKRVNDTDRPHVVRLNADGSIDSSYHPDLSGFIETPHGQIDTRGRVVLHGQALRNGTVVASSARLQDDGSRDPTYYSVTDLPNGTFFSPENGLPNLNFPQQATDADGKTQHVYSGAEADNGTIWVINPLARFTVSDVDTITVDPTDRAVVSGHNTIFYVGIGTRAAATYQWFHDGTPIAGATLPYLELDNVQVAQAGSYTVQVTVDGKTLTSRPGNLTVVGGSVRLVNFSARAVVASGAAPFAGFNIGGDGAKRDWLVRAIGPSLFQFGVNTALLDPRLTLIGTGRAIQSDRNGIYNPDVMRLGHDVGAFPATPASVIVFPEPTDSAMIATLDPGSYTATATSLGGRQGITLLEVYDSIPTGASGSLRNVSLRARTGGGANVATLGFALVGNTAARLLVRGVGPTLSVFGISGSLQDPVLSLFRPQYPSLLATNAGWANDGSIAAAAKSSGAFALPANSHDAAMVVALNPGTYTVQLTSASSTTGEGLIEVYLLGQQ